MRVEAPSVRLIQAGADPNEPDPHGDLPLIGASYEGMLAAVDVLLAAGADPALTNRHGQNAFTAAAELDDDELRARLGTPGSLA